MNTNILGSHHHSIVESHTMMEAAPDLISGGAISSSSASSSPMANSNNSQNGGGEEVIDSPAVAAPATTEVVDIAFATMDGEETTSIGSENVSPGTVEVQLDGTTDVNGSLGDELDKLSSEFEDLSTFDLLDGDDDFD